MGLKPSFLIVDGQQRIRSLRHVFENDEADRSQGESDGPDPPVAVGNGKRQRVWCLNLAQVPELSDRFAAGSRFNLFGLHLDPLATWPGSGFSNRQDRKGLLPLVWFLDHQADPEHALGESRHTPAAEAVEAALSSESIAQRLRVLKSAKLFYVNVLGREYSSRSVVSAYNRINSAGKRVEAEERAFANLVSVTDYAEEALKNFFRRTASWRPAEGAPDTAPQNSTSVGKRDGLLQREKESRFGFKLFMRAFVITFGYHADRTIGSSSFSFDSVEPETLDGAKEHLKPILDGTVELLIQTADVLRSRLHCDDFRMLPDTASLWPLLLEIHDPLSGSDAGVSRQAGRHCSEIDVARPVDQAVVGPGGPSGRRAERCRSPEVV